MLVVETGIRPASFLGDLTDLNRRLLSRARRAALFLAVAALLGVLAPQPECAANGTNLPWRSLEAPSERSQLLAFVTEDQEPPATGGETDTTKKEIQPPATQQPPPTNTTPTFQNQDNSNSKHADSIRAFPGTNAAPLETLGATNRTFTGAATTSLPAGAHVRRGLFGIPPLALLAGLIAVHIFVVTKVVK